MGPSDAGSKFVGAASLDYSLGRWTLGVRYNAAISSQSVFQSGLLKISDRF
ncbi:hypothetical protein D3C83_318920 [compost metagenome]